MCYSSNALFAGCVRCSNPPPPTLFVYDLHRFSEAGLLKAALVYVIMLGGLFQGAVRQSAEASHYPTSVSALHVLQSLAYMLLR